MDLHAPLGLPGSVLLDELVSIHWRHAPEPRRAATLLVADLPPGRLELRCNESVDEVTATLDGVPVGRVHSPALRHQGIVYDMAPGHKIEVGDRSGPLTWRMRGSKLRPLGRTRWFEVDLHGEPYSCFMKAGFTDALVRSATPDGEPVVLIGKAGHDVTAPKVVVKDLDETKHTLNWFAGTTTAELVLAELRTMGMTHPRPVVVARQADPRRSDGLAARLRRDWTTHQSDRLRLLAGPAPSASRRAARPCHSG